jgi:uncharacterized protein
MEEKIMSNGNSRSQGGWLAMATAIVVSTVLAGSAVDRIRSRAVRKIDVTGSAKRRIVSDLIQWQASIATQNTERTKAYRDLNTHVQAVMKYLGEQGVKPDEIRPSSTTIAELIETEIVIKGEDRFERRVLKGYRAEQSVVVRSKDVDRIERLSREITQLLDRGIPVSSHAPSYFYTKLGELKIEMLAEAAKDARVRAESMVKQTGGAQLGKLRTADMGVINVNAANSTETSWQGNNDTLSLEKDIITIVHVTFELD